MRRRLITFSAWATWVLCFPSQAQEAPRILCLTGNSANDAQNRLLPEAGYRYLWTGTDQPIYPADRYLAGWISFAEGLLCDGQAVSLPFQGQLRDKSQYTHYAWPSKGYEIEVDLGQVCDVRRVGLTGSRAILLRGFSPAVRRWLSLAAGTNEITLEGLLARRFRVDVNGGMAELYVWGIPLPENAEERLPAPQAPSDPAEPFTRLDLKPSPVPLAPSPFVYPQPQEMAFTEKSLDLPAGCPLVLPKDAVPTIRGIAETLAASLRSLIGLETRLAETAEGAGIWMGLASDAGLWSEISQNRKLAQDQIPAEGYAVEVTPSRVVLVGRDGHGLYNATRTLLFLVEPRPQGASVPVGYVRDFPRSEIRPAFAFEGWDTPFKHRLAAALAALKYSYLEGSDPPRDLMRQNYLRYIIQGALYPQSQCGTDGDLLEALPGIRAKALNPARLSACGSHPEFWKGMIAAWERKLADWNEGLVDVGYDEILHNPYNVCARCRARGLSSREMLLDVYLKAHQYLTKRGFGVLVYVTGFRQFEPFDMFVDIPRDSVLVNYQRDKENRELKELGFRVIAGSTGPVYIGTQSRFYAGMVWNWGSEHPAAMFSEGVIRSQTIVAEENWSSAGKPEWQSPLWHARLNRAIDFVQHMVDGVPLPVPGATYSYFTVKLAGQANRSLKDEVYGDGEGWFDEGPTRDLRHLPAGSQALDGIPYTIAEGRDAAVVVAGPGSADHIFPDQVLGIPVGRRAGELFFLHTCARHVWTSLGRRIPLLGFYRIRYADGTFVTAEVNYGQHVHEWLKAFGYRKMDTEPTGQPLCGARVAWRGGTDGGHDVTLYSMSWRNPYPEKEIAMVDVLASAQRESNGNALALIAVTGRDVTERDTRAAPYLADRPTPRQYRPRPELPPRAEALDLTRKSPPPFPVPAAHVTEWQTTDKWFSASIRRLKDDGLPLAYEKSESNCGPYSVLDPDDDPWRCAIENRSTPSEITVQFKRNIPVCAIEVKGIMQRIRYPGTFPTDFEVFVRPQGGGWESIGRVSNHVGQEGVERWVRTPPTPLSGVRVRVTQGSGLSAIHLYTPKPLPPARFKPTEMDKSKIAIGEETKEREKVSEEDVVDEFEGAD